VAGHKPKPSDTTHDAIDVLAVVEAVSDRSEENDAVAKFSVYATLNIQHYWIIRGDAEADEVDGMITMYELRGGVYEVAGHRLVSKID
jgi:Uma2 family endonuclease